MSPPNNVLSRHGRLYQLQGKRCYLCGGRFNLKAHRNPGWPTRDHVRPKVKGGLRLRNTLIAHAQCNEKKGARDPHPCELLYLEAINLMMEK